MEEHKYVSTQQVAASDRYPFTLGQIRHYLLMRHKNGLDMAVRKVGKRCYFRADLLDQWIEAQAEKGGEA